MAILLPSRTGCMCIAAIAVAGVLSACGGSESAETPVSWRTLDQARHSGITSAEQRTVDDATAWQALWSRHVGAQLVAAPTVDFTQRQVVAVFLGARPSGCQTVTIRQVVDRRDTREVRYAEHVPGPTEVCTAEVITPAHLVEVPRTGLPVAFVKVAEGA